MDFLQRTKQCQHLNKSFGNCTTENIWALLLAAISHEWTFYIGFLIQTTKTSPRFLSGEGWTAIWCKLAGLFTYLRLHWCQLVDDASPGHFFFNFFYVITFHVKINIFPHSANLSFRLQVFCVSSCRCGGQTPTWHFTDLHDTRAVRLLHSSAVWTLLWTWLPLGRQLYRSLHRVRPFS